MSGFGRHTVITSEMKAIVEAKMREDDETTAEQLHSFLAFRGFRISILCCHADLGWTFRGSAYCQVIRAPNKLKRCNGLKLTCRTASKTSFGLMNVRCILKPTKDSGAGSRENHPDQSQGDHLIFT